MNLRPRNAAICITASAVMILMAGRVKQNPQPVSPMAHPIQISASRPIKRAAVAITNTAGNVDLNKEFGEMISLQRPYRVSPVTVALP